MSEASLQHWNPGGGHFFWSIYSFEEEFQQRRRLQVMEACWLKPRRSLLHSFTLRRRFSGKCTTGVGPGVKATHGEVRSKQREILYPRRTSWIDEEERLYWLEATCRLGSNKLVDSWLTFTFCSFQGHTAMLNGGCWHPKIKEEFMTCSNDGWVLNNV